MNRIELSEVPGYFPLVERDALHGYAEERGTDAIIKESLRAGLQLTNGELFDMLVSDREARLKKLGCAPYVTTLCESLRGHIEQRGTNWAVAEGLGGTALTTLFGSEYGVNLDNFIGPEGKVRLFASVDPQHASFVSFRYQSGYQDDRSHTEWKVTMNSAGRYINMYTYGQRKKVINEHGFENHVTIPETLPLHGAGNIAMIPGVEGALALDIAQFAHSLPDVTE